MNNETTSAVAIPVSAPTPVSEPAISAGLWMFAKEWLIFELCKNYVDYIMDNKIIDNKAACIEHVGKIVSVLMDRGECSIAEWERVKNYIEQRPVLLAAQCELLELDQLVDKLVAALCKHTGVAFVTGLSGNIAPSEKETIAKFLEAKNAYKTAWDNVCVLFRKPSLKFTASILESYRSLFDASFIEKLETKLCLNLVEYRQP